MSLAIVKRIAAKLKLGDEGKLNSFFEKQVKISEKAIRDLNRNKATLENSYKDSVEDYKDQLEDAQEALVASYEDVSPEDVATNAAQASFAEGYWQRVKNAKSAVLNIEKQMERAEENYKKEVETIEKQITAYQERIDILKK